MKLLFSFFILISCKVMAMVSLAGAYDMRLEKDVYQNANALGYQNYSFSYGYQSWAFGFEYFLGEEQGSGQNTLSISKSRNGGYLTVAYYSNFKWKYVKPFFDAGLGLYQEQVVTKFYQYKDVDKSKSYAGGFGGVGFRFSYEFLFTDLEARLVFGENLDPQPSFSTLFRLGISL